MNDETRLEKLRWAIHGVKAPFSSAGTFIPEKPLTLVFRDKSRFTVERAKNGYEQVRALNPLIDRCQPATFGDKRRTRIDRSVRDAVQLKAENGGFSVEHFDPEAAGILEAIRRQMLYHQDARFQAKQTQLDQRSANTLKGRDQLVAATALQAGLDVSFAPYLFETCVDETWQLERFPTRKETSRMKRQMDLSDLESALPIRGESSEKVGDFGVTWLEPPPSSGSSQALRGSNTESSSGLPAAGRLHSCEYCEWGYFGKEASDVDSYIYAALHVKIPKLGEGPRANVQPEGRATIKKARGAGTKATATKKKTRSTKKLSAKSRKKKDGG